MIRKIWIKLFIFQISIIFAHRERNTILMSNIAQINDIDNTQLWDTTSTLWKQLISIHNYTTTAGVRQGDSLNLLLFIIFMGDILKACQYKNFKLGHRQLEPVTFFSLALIVDSKDNFQHNVKVWVKGLEKRNMQVRLEKSKSMVVSITEKRHLIRLNGNHWNKWGV